MNIDAALEAAAIKRVELAELAKIDLFYLSQTILGMSDVTRETHGGMIKVLQSDSKRKMVVMPRGSLKSSVGVVAYSIFRLLQDPNERILIDSELYTNSKNFLREIKQHLESKNLELLYGKFKGPIWNESEIVINQRTKSYKEASITVGGIGTTKVGQHYTVIIGDDYSSLSNVNTKENAQKVVDHYRMNISILEPQGTYVIIGTRYSERDIIGWIIENEVNAKIDSGGLINVSFTS